MHTEIDKLEGKHIEQFKKDPKNKDFDDDEMIQFRLDLGYALVFQLHALGVDKDSMRNFFLDMIDESVIKLREFKESSE
jgi:hypothetical protein